MHIYQLDRQNNRCNEISMALNKGYWIGNDYRKSIAVRFDNAEDFEQYRHIPVELLKLYPDFENSECTVKYAMIKFFFAKDQQIKVTGEVYVQCPGVDPDLYITHKVIVDISRIEIAKSLAWYFATNPEQSNHSTNHLQSLYWRFIEWGFIHFSLQFEELDVGDQESCISALYDAFKQFSNNPYIPSNPQKRGCAAIYWRERNGNGKDSHHYLFMDRNWRIFHYCEADGAMFDRILENEE